MPEGGYITFTFVRGPEASAEVSEDTDTYRALTLSQIYAKADAICRIDIYRVP